MAESLAEIDELCRLSAGRHDHLCPKQVLGVRIGVAALERFGVGPRPEGKRFLVFVETDGCFASGVEAATGAAVDHRTLRVEDCGKLAATIVDTTSGEAYRFVPKSGVRTLGCCYAPEAANEYQAQILGYQRMPIEELCDVTAVCLKVPVKRIVSMPGRRTVCAVCGEEIINEREVVVDGKTLCKTCAGDGYYVPLDAQ